jgi:hypothetical protein
VKTLVQQLYTTLCIEQHQLNKERELIERLEVLKEQLAPLEKVKIQSQAFLLTCSCFSSKFYVIELCQSNYSLLIYRTEP